MKYKIIAERKLKSDWNQKIDDDCEAFHMIDAEEELAYILSKQIRDEMNKKNCKNTLKPTKHRSKPNKEYYGDVRYENDGNCDYGDPVGPLGKKGKVIYAPYVPFQMKQVTYGPTNAPDYKVKSRYSNKKIKDYGDCGEANCTYDDRG